MLYYSLKVSSTPDQLQNMPIFHLFINFLRELFDYWYLLHITLNLPPCNTHFLRLCSSSKNSCWATAKLTCMTTVYLFFCRYQYDWRQSYRYRQASSHFVNAQAGHEELPRGFHGLTNNCRCFWLSATLTSAAKESQFTVRRTPRVFPLRTYNNVRSYSWSSCVIDWRFFFVFFVKFLACLLCPSFLEEQSYPQDIKEKARRILAATRQFSIGAIDFSYILFCCHFNYYFPD